MTQDNQYQRIIAHSNGNLLSNCEECGKPIPVELTRCDECEGEHDPDALREQLEGFNTVAT